MLRPTAVSENCGTSPNTGRASLSLLELDFAELLLFALLELDFAELLEDFAELLELDFTELLDLAELDDAGGSELLETSTFL